jgi:hypothetical protein
MRLALVWVILLSASATARAAPSSLYVYTGDVGPRHVLIAWGAARGQGNTIGRDSISHGKARLRVGPNTVETTRAWAVVEGLEPDHSYDYELTLDGAPVAKGHVRTWPEIASTCSYIVIGDFGDGRSGQQRVAEAMARVVRERASTANPIRFVLTTGDNIYSVVPGVWLAGSGGRDADWAKRFFSPYRDTLASIPFFPVLGNHDGNESEKRADLDVYFDNFFFPGNRPARWYQFNYAGLIDFFALDSTANSELGPPAPVWLPGGVQHQWARKALHASRSPWKLVYIHHPIFNAGPGHEKERNFERMSHLLDLFGETGVQAVFQGHEHNFQVSRLNPRSRGIRFFVSGAGGELRKGSVVRKMEANNIEGWSAQRHFLVVDAGPDRLTVTPAGDRPIKPVRADGSPFHLPVVVERTRATAAPSGLRD